MIRSAAIAIGAFAALAGVLRFAGSIAELDVDTVRVSGTLNDAESAQVRAAVSSALVSSGVGVAQRVAAAVQALDWVREVRVRRQWPDALHVAVARETLAARWGETGWLTTSGSVVAAPFDQDDPRLATLPVLRASVADGASAMRVFGVLGAAGRSAELRLVGLEEDAGGEWKASFQGEAGQVDVALGATDLRDRIARFAAVYRQALRHAKRPVLYADARYDTGVAVRWGAVEERAASANTQLAAVPWRLGRRGGEGATLVALHGAAGVE